MKETLEHIITQIILSKYPKVISLDDIEDIKETYGLEHLEHNYHVSFSTSECLDSTEMMAIDEDVKTLFAMTSPKQINPFSHNKPKIMCFFDCGDGEGYNFSGNYGYKH